MSEPGVAAVLSAIIPGVGQFYNGRFLAGILWLIITPGLWIGTGGLLGWVCHVISAYTQPTPTHAIIEGNLGNDRLLERRCLDYLPTAENRELLATVLSLHGTCNTAWFWSSRGTYPEVTLTRGREKRRATRNYRTTGTHYRDNCRAQTRGLVLVLPSLLA